MNREDIIRMAREAGFDFNSLGGTYTSGKLNEYLELFASIVEKEVKREAGFDRAELWLGRINRAIQEEREACAKVLDEMVDQMIADMEPSTAINWVRNRAAAIRSRSSEHCARDEATSRGQT